MPSGGSVPLVSVCIPVYNGMAHLEEALASVLGQTHPNVEVRIFDDGSTDGSWDWLQGLRDPRVILHRNERNLGPEGNWNQALHAAQGPYLKLFHQDDLLDPECLARQVALLEEDPEAVLAFCRRTIIRPDGRKLFSRGGPWAGGRVEARAAARACALRGSNLLGEPSALLLRTSAVRATGGFDACIPYLVDLDYWLRLMTLGPAVYEDRALASFRVSKRQWSARIGLAQGAEFAAFLDRLAKGPLRGRPLTRLVGKGMGHVQGVLRSLLYRLI